MARAVVAGAGAAACAGALGGCGGHPQSALDPAGPVAETIAGLWWFLFGLLTVVFVITIALLLIGLAKRPRPGREGPGMGATRFVVLTGLVVPSVILVVMLLASVTVNTSLEEPEEGENLLVRVVGHRWWWEVRYPELGIVSANQIHIPVGRTVRFELTSNDVIHSFWVPNLSGKMDLMPDHVTRTWFRADRAGVFRGQCAEYCGLQHALMAFYVVAMEPEEFDRWASERSEAREAAPEVGTEEQPEGALVERGREVFFGEDAGCYTCHAVRGTPAVGNIGPDLTHIGSRLTLGAGTIPNTRETLAAWILDPQEIKPGNRMPGTVIAPEDLRALVEYLMSLE